MTTNLDSVIKQLSDLPEAEQDAIAALLQHEMDWVNRLERSADALAKLATEAVQEYDKGKTRPMPFE